MCCANGDCGCEESDEERMIRDYQCNCKCGCRRTLRDRDTDRNDICDSCLFNQHLKPPNEVCGPGCGCENPIPTGGIVNPKALAMACDWNFVPGNITINITIKGADPNVTPDIVKEAVNKALREMNLHDRR